MNVNYFEIAKGQSVTVVAAILKGDDCPYLDFKESLGKKEQNKITSLCKFISDFHPLPNKEKYKKVEKDIYEIKPDNFIRIFCFQRGSKLILANGYKKKKDKLDKNEISRAERIRNDYDRS